MSRRTLDSIILFLFSVVSGVLLVVSVVMDWPTDSSGLRGLVRGASVGGFGTLIFWSGYRAAADQAAHNSRQGAREAAPGSGTLATPEDSKRWLQKFLEEQQRAGKGPT